jgi:hypothetical protein
MRKADDSDKFVMDLGRKPGGDKMGSHLAEARIA